jgi:CheY-like chemotaxis protein
MKKIIVSESVKLVINKGDNFFLRSGLTILTAPTGEDVLTLHRLEKVDLIIIDLNMPIIAGDEICRLIREDHSLKNVPIILVHPYKKADIKRCESCGANALLAEPVGHEELFNEISTVLQIPKRESMRVLMRVTVKGNTDHKFFFSISRDISSSGILIETDHILSKGEHITCSFFIKSHQITAHGQIVRIIEKGPDRYQYGIKFINLDHKSKSMIEAFVKNRQQSEYGNLAY